MVPLRNALLLGLLAYVGGGPPPQSDAVITPAAVGTQDGAFSVNASGGAAYQMDLDVPPGTQGVQPNLSIWYVSQSTNGLLGNGFALEGLSSITRCQATAKLDGYNGGVGFDAKDRYCLDGQRLVKISGGSDYGAAGSVYHTENETWTKVVATGTCGSGPCSFAVTNKDGHTLEFGTGTSGVKLPDRDEIAAWQIAGMTDLNGNRVSVTYKFNADSLQNLPAEIRYTENQNAGIAATRKVTFEYEPRSQKIPRYVGGYLFLLQDRLKAIRTWLDGAEVLAYNLTYTVSEGTERDLLQALQKCAPQRVCYPATTFTYTRETNTFVTPNDKSDGELRRSWCTESNALIGWMDFNADGLPDVHCDTPTGTHRVLLSTGTELKTPNETKDGLIQSKWCTGNAFPSWIDFNGDAKADLACDGEDGSHRVLVSDGANVKSPNKNEDGLVKSSWCGGSTSRPQWGNFNEDGRADLLCSSTDGIQRALVSTGTGVTTPNEYEDGEVRRSWCASKDAVVLWGDFNGDHMSDAHCSRTNGVQQVLLSNGSKLVTPNKSTDGDVANSWCGGTDRRRGLTDFNGDGLLDSTCDSADGRHWVMFSTGRELKSPNSNSEGLVRSSWCTGSGAVQSWGDFNGDGLSDLQCRDSSGLLALLSTGSTLQSPNSSSTGLLKTNWCTPAQGQPRWTDFNADSLDDVTCHSPTGLQQALVHSAGMADLVSKIIDGIGMTVELTYAPLTDAKVYGTGDAVSYPMLDIRSPMYVVSRYVTLDGRGGRYAFKYRYKGARTDLEAQRWLGFQQVAFTEESIGRQTVTNYEQKYPLMSFVTSTVILDSKNIRQAETAYEPLIRNPYPNVFEVLVAKESQSTFTSGVADYVATKTFDYDEYGNPDFVADVSVPYYAVYNCQRYANSTTPWRMGYPTAQKTARTAEACRDLDRWNAANDLRWSTTTYDARMNPTSLAAWDDVNAGFVTSSETFGPAGNVLTSTDPAGNTTTYTWDETLTYPKSQTSPPISGGRHLTTSFTYHRAWGEVATVTDPNGNVTETLIDGFGRTTEVRGPDPDASTGAPAVTLQKFTYAQDISGRYVEMRQRQTWADANPANWYYERQYQDGMGRIFLERSRSARGVDVAVETLYDTSARIWKTAIPHYNDASVHYVVNEYDVLDRPTLVVQPDSTLTKIEYRKGQLEIHTTEAFGNAALARTTIDSLDPRFLNLKSIAPNGGVTTSTYDPIGQQLTNVRATGSSTIATYDSLGRPVKSVDSDSGTSTFSYGKNGLLQSSTDGAGHTVRFEYDTLERPKSRILSPADGPPEVYLFEYDSPNYANALGELSTSVGPSYTQDYAYSRYGLATHQQLTLDGNMYTGEIAYDPPGRSALRTYADGSQLRTTWYVDGTLHKQDLKQPGENDFTNYATYTAYTALQQPETLISGNGLRTDNTYYPIKEGMARPKTTVVSKGTSAVFNGSYEWNPLAQMTSMSRVQVGQPMQSASYVHDKMGWLTSATGTNGNYSFAYDLAGNVTEKDGVRYTYPKDSDRATGASNGAAFQYDGAGNMKQKHIGSSAWQYHHDAASRLAKILLNDKVVATHLYDSTDSRLRRTDASGNVSTYIDGDTDLYQSGNNVLLTKYVIGVSGPLATVTTTYTPQALRGALQKQKTLLEADRYSKGSLPWIGAVIRSLVLRASEGITPIAAIIVFLFVAQTLLSVLIRRRTDKSVCATPYVRRHPLFSSFIPPLLCGLMLLSAQELRGDLGPGGGYPVAGTLYFHGDQVYSTLLVTTADGTESTSLAYAPFGTVDQKHSSGPNNFRAKFTTKEHDDESQLDYFGARYYDSQIGRFLEPDPQSQFASAYVYGANDPIDMYDPDGQFAVLAIVIAAVIGAVTGAYMGGVAANNNNFNPLQWNWSSAHTWAGVFGGAAIGAATGALGAAIGSVAGPAVGIIAEIILSAGENAAFTALAGGSGKEILNAAILGGVMGGVAMGASLGLAKVFSRSASSGGRLAQRAERELLPSGGSPARCRSFPAGTLVATDEGLEPIETVTPGTSVLSADDAPSNVVPFPVLETRNRSNASLVAVAAGGTTIKATPDHPFWVDAKGWTNASDLHPGDMLVTAADQRVPVESVKPLAETAKVFNFEVDRGHSYFVSPLRLLVHNPSDCGRPVTRAYRKTFKDKGHDLLNIRGGKRRRLPPNRFGDEVSRKGRYVNFRPVSDQNREVLIKYTGSRYWDYKAADKAAKISRSYRVKRDLVWHHVEGITFFEGEWVGRMQLIPRQVHEAWPHWGGVEEWSRIHKVAYK